jgi:hypothetical protein
MRPAVSVTPDTSASAALKILSGRLVATGPGPRKRASLRGAGSDAAGVRPSLYRSEEAQRGCEERVVSTRVKMALVVILTSLLALTSCNANEQVRADDEETQASAVARAGAERTVGQTAGEHTASKPAAGREGGAVARAGDNAVARAGDGAVARAGDVEARAKGGEDEVVTNGGGGSAQEVTLEVGGDDGTRFSGVCFVGGQEKVIGGRVPARYVYQPGGDKLECEIRKEGSGALEVVLTAGSNVRSVQRTEAQKSTINVAYSSGRLSSSVSSSSG